MEKISVDAVVVKVSVTGESDRIVWLLTGRNGIIRAFAKGARKVKGKLHGAASPFVYGTFWLTETKGSYNITDAEIKEMFFPLREELERLTLAQYFCEIAVKCIDEGNSSEDHLRLLLNSLYFLCNGKKDPLMLKSLYEIRSCVLLGYSPDVIACDLCGEFETPYMYFDCTGGNIFCEKCGNPQLFPRVELSVISAIRHFVFSDFNKVFSYDYSKTDLTSLNHITEQYFLNCIQLHFETLEFYHK